MWTDSAFDQAIYWGNHPLPPPSSDASIDDTTVTGTFRCYLNPQHGK